MNNDRTVFSQILDFIPKYQFRACVNRYNGNYRVKFFSCFDQYLTMAFAQLTYRESLRDIQICLRALDEKLIDVLATAEMLMNKQLYSDSYLKAYRNI